MPTKRKMKRRGKAERSARRGRAPGRRGNTSGLWYASEALRRARKPMRVRAMTAAAMKLGWKPKGKTPHQTMAAAVHREIKLWSKVRGARFRRAGRGLFALARSGRRSKRT